MAKNGLSTFLYAPYNEEKNTYGDVGKLAGAISYKETLTKSETEIHADNTVAISDSSVTGGTLALEVDDDDPEIFGPLLGRKKKTIKVEGKTEEVNVGNSSDTPIPIGFGFIENERSRAASWFTVNFYPKVTFAPYDKENATKNKNNEYKTPTVTGTLYNIDNGDYKYDKRYKTMLDALKTLYALFGKTLPAEIADKYAEDNLNRPEEEVTE